jgi:hypothetical protein
MPDINIENHGSIFLFHPNTPEGGRWLEENVQSESWQWFGKALSVDHRYAQGLAAAALDDGLSVE